MRHRHARLVLALLLIVACGRDDDGPRYFSRRDGFSFAALEGWTESRELGSLVFTEGAATIAIRRVEPSPRDPELVISAAETVLRSLPGAEVSPPSRRDRPGIHAASFDLTFRPERAGRRPYERRHVVLVGRRVFHLIHTAPAGGLDGSATAFERAVQSFREEG